MSQPETGLQRFGREVKAEVGRMGRLGAYELGSAIFQEHGYRGDLGLLTHQQETGALGDSLKDRGAQEVRLHHEKEQKEPQRDKGMER